MDALPQLIAIFILIVMAIAVLMMLITRKPFIYCIGNMFLLGGALIIRYR